MRISLIHPDRPPVTFLEESQYRNRLDLSKIYTLMKRLTLTV